MTPPAHLPMQVGRHLVVAVAIGLVAPFTVFAWPFALLTGTIIGNGQVEQAHGLSVPLGARLVRIAAVTGGVLAMLISGVVLGGLIAFLIVALAAFSERLSGDASPTDRTLARIVTFIGGGVGWIVLGSLLGLHLTIHFGA